MLQLPPGYPWVFSKIFGLFGPAVWSAIANIHTYKYLFMSEERKSVKMFIRFLVGQFICLQLFNDYENHEINSTLN